MLLRKEEHGDCTLFAGVRSLIRQKARLLFVCLLSVNNSAWGRLLINDSTRRRLLVDDSARRSLLVDHSTRGRLLVHNHAGLLHSGSCGGDSLRSAPASASVGIIDDILDVNPIDDGPNAAASASQALQNSKTSVSDVAAVNTMNSKQPGAANAGEKGGGFVVRRLLNGDNSCSSGHVGEVLPIARLGEKPATAIKNLGTTKYTKKKQ